MRAPARAPQVGDAPQPGAAGRSYGQLSTGSAVSSNPSAERPDRLIIVSNQLPVRMKKATTPEPGATHSWVFEWDEEALGHQAKAGIEQPQFSDIQAGAPCGGGAAAAARRAAERGADRDCCRRRCFMWAS